jgi:uncharacterized protein YqjF (DUF2071 family)
MEKIKLYFLSSLFFFAGLTHLLSPQFFFNAIPDALIYKGEINLVVGVLEIILSLCLISQKKIDLTSRLTALYLILLIPIHVYVSMYEKEIMGISSPLILWGRTLFQFVLIFLALTLQDKGALIYQRWRDVIFLHYFVEAKEIESMVPFPLDLYQGKAVVSIVPFKMDRIRFPFLPALPGISKLHELNLRTYVNVNGVKGVYFFTLETDSFIGELLARSFFKLPYKKAALTADRKINEIQFNYMRDKFSLNLNATIDNSRDKNPLEVWALERYHLFLKHKKKTYQGTATHAPWSVCGLKIRKLNDHFTIMIGHQESFQLVSTSYTKDLSVSFSPFKEVLQDG